MKVDKSNEQHGWVCLNRKNVIYNKNRSTVFQYCSSKPSSSTTMETKLKTVFSHGDHNGNVFINSIFLRKKSIFIYLLIYNLISEKCNNTKLTLERSTQQCIIYNLFKRWFYIINKISKPKFITIFFWTKKFFPYKIFEHTFSLT